MNKLKLVAGVFFLLFLLIVAKLFYLQVISPFSASQNNYLQNNIIKPTRGKIFDRNGSPLAINQTQYLLFVQPKLVEDKDILIHQLDSILSLGEATLSGMLDMNKNWIALKSVDKSTQQKILSLNLKGIGFQNENARSNPEASLAAHLLGFVGKDIQGNNLGYFGIEGYYNQDLTGLPGIFKTERDILNQPILFGTQEKLDPENGRDLYLSLDKSVQDIAKSALNKGLQAYKAQSGCVIVADPNTVQILALSCLPDFDVGKYYLFSENFFKDPAISDVYEPGSIFKPLVMAAAIQENKISPQDLYDENGPVKIGNYQIQTWDNTYEGKITMTRILEKSSNTGMVYIGSKLGNDLLYQYLQKYGFGETTGIDLQGEVAGYLRPKDQWYPIDYSTVTFGQGIAVTPIQMIRAFSAIVNGGKLMRPYVVQKIASGDQTIQIQPKVERQVLSHLTSEILKKMLVAAVEHGEVKWQRPAGYVIGGKTGTAQVPIQGHYDPSKTIASFIGFAPAEKPKFIALVMLSEPKTSPWGSETAAPIFFEIAKQLLVYYNIPPEQ